MFYQPFSYHEILIDSDLDLYEGWRAASFPTASQAVSESRGKGPDGIATINRAADAIRNRSARHWPAPALALERASGGPCL